ncbi:Gfo/Idh/MocA family protein [Georgenia sp. Marseille-Q6866]
MTLRIGVLSSARHAADHLRILGQDERVELVAVAEEPSAPELVRGDSRAAAGHAGVRYTEDVEEVLDPSRVDLVLVSGAPVRHARLALAALLGGVDVLVDQPVATTLDDADALLAAAERTGRVCAVVNRTHATALRRTRAWVDAGHVGLPRHIDMELLASGAAASTGTSSLDPALSGGGEVLSFLGSCTDAIRYLTGLPVLEVHALTGTLFSELHATHDVEDTAVVSLLLDRGVTATVTLGRVPYTPGATPTASSLRLLGSHGHAVADDDKPCIDVVGPGGPSALVADAGTVALERCLRHVVDSLVAGRVPDYTVRQARESIAVVDAAYRSARAGDVVVLH